MGKILFWTSLISIAYSYFGYFFILKVISVFRSRPVKKEEFFPSVSFIITAYNEEEQIKNKILNTLKQDYPKEKLEIIVASDCSSDQTDSIVSSFKNDGVKLVRTSERRGKESAQKDALEHASGEIIVFSDVATILEETGVRNIVMNFADVTVGCVSSEDKFLSEDGTVSGEGAYVRYEMALRNLESQVNTLVGLSGSFFATRKRLCKNFAGNMQSDFLTLINSIKMGSRGVSDPNAIGYYKDIKKGGSEFDRKVRTVLRGMTVFFSNTEFLNPLRYRFFSFQIVSHKLFRWLVPIFMVVLFFSNAYILNQSIWYQIFFFLQSAFYFLAFSYPSIEYLSKNKFFRLAYFFSNVNLAILVAWFKLISGEIITIWEPSKR